MKKLKLFLSLLVFVGITFSSCIKHEVIPAPLPLVDLVCYYDGFVNGTPLTLTQNVNGIYGIAEKAQNILPAPSFSNERYYFTMLTPQNTRSITIGLGSVFWDGSVDTSPTIVQFNTFHANNLNPVFSDGALSGCEVKYTDSNGKVWYSHENSTNFQDATFQVIEQASDSTGDYSRFNCVFDCYVYNQDPVTLAWDSMRVQATQFKGWFKR